MIHADQDEGREFLPRESSLADIEDHYAAQGLPASPLLGPPLSEFRDQTVDPPRSVFSTLRFSPHLDVLTFDTRLPPDRLLDPPGLTPVGERPGPLPPDHPPVGEGGAQGARENEICFDQEPGVIALRPVENPTRFPPNFGPEEEVKLDPRIFALACKWLEVRPQVDLFASDVHHQLDEYYSVDQSDPNAKGIDAFNFVWESPPVLYINPPWTLIGKVLAKIIHDQAYALLVTPEYRRAPWQPMLDQVIIKSFLWTKPLYLDDQGKLRPQPRWNTRFSVVLGR